MSVVNRMLRDLDRRQGGEGKAVYSQHLRPVDGASAQRTALVAALVLVIVVLGGALFYVMQKPAETVVVAAQAAVPISAPAPTVQPVPSPTAAPDNTVSNAAVAEQDSASASPPSKIEGRRSQQDIVPPLAAAAPPAAPAPVVDTRKTALSSSTVVATVAPIPSVEAPAVAPAPTQHAGPTRIDVRPRTLPTNTAEGEFNRAIALVNQGRAEEARAALSAALKIDPRHEGARQTLAVLQVEAGYMNEAQATLSEGISLNPSQANFAMLLARLKVETGDNKGALEVLRGYQQQGKSNAELRAFAGTLLQRMGQPADAIEEYRAALTLSPNVGIWWVGLALSYEGMNRSGEAIDAYQRARISGNLPVEVAEFVERKLQTLR